MSVQPPTLDAPIARPGDDVADRPTARDDQRQTLADLIRLATECSTLDAEIEKRLADKTLAADKQLKGETSTLTAAGVDRLSASQQARGEELEQIESTYRGDKKRIEKARDDQQRKILTEHDNAANRIKKEYQDATWLVDSILDTSIIEAQKAHKATMERTAADRESLDEQRDAGLASLHRYGQQHLAARLSELPARPDAGAGDFDAAKASLASTAASMNGLLLARLFVGVWPFLASLLVIGGAIAATQPWRLIGTASPDWRPVAYVGGAAVLIVIVAWIVLARLASKQVRAAWDALLGHLATGHAALDARIVDADKLRDATIVDAKHSNAEETRKLKDKYVPMADRAKARRDELSFKLKNESDAQLKGRSKQRDRDAQAAKVRHEANVRDLEKHRGDSLAAATGTREGLLAAARVDYDRARADLQQRWDEGLESTRAQNAMENAADSVRVGSLTIDLRASPPRAARAPPSRASSRRPPTTCRLGCRCRARRRC